MMHHRCACPGCQSDDGDCFWVRDEWSPDTLNGVFLSQRMVERIADACERED